MSPTKGIRDPTGSSLKKTTVIQPRRTEAQEAQPMECDEELKNMVIEEVYTKNNWMHPTLSK